VQCWSVLPTRLCLPTVRAFGFGSLGRLSVTGETLVTNRKSRETKNAPLEEQARPLGLLRDWVSRTPAAAFVAVAATMFVAETLGGWRLVEWFPALASLEMVLGILLDMVIVVPVLLFLFVLPSARNVGQREASERALQVARDELEVRVRERTAELAAANRRLREEEQALRESEEKYSTLVERSPTGIFIFQNGALAFVNRRFADLLAYSDDELSHVEPWFLVHPEDRERVQEIAGKRIAGEPVPEEYQCRLITKTGQVRWVAMQNTLIRYRGEIATLGNVQDVTEHELLETELRQLSARLLTIQEEVQQRVARDLHDSVGQKLTGIKFLLEAALGPPWPEERRSRMERLRSLVPTIQDAVEEVWRISMALRPSSLDDLGLLPTIAWYLREYEKTQPGVLVEQQVNATESDVPSALRTPIFRILQEASNNVAKHSGASHLVIGLEADKGLLRLRVQDDGAGFDPVARPGEVGKGGSGLTSMRERTELSGGSFSLASVPGAGTTVEANWPLDPPVSE